jgi:DNA-binding CsgD family transcriptional regulator
MSTGRHHAGPGASAPPLFGRDQELARVRDLIDGVSDGGAALVIRGEAGVGKSALLAQAVEWGVERQFSVLTVTGVQSEGRLAFAGLHQLLHPFLGALRDLPGPQRGALETAFGIAQGDAPEVFLIALAALGVVADAADSAPLLLVIDDAQWLDGLSCEVLGFVGRRLGMEPAVLLIGVRDGVGGPADALGLPELRLSALADEAARAMLTSGAGDLPADLQARVLREAAGNPLALIELPKALARRHDDRPAPQDALPLTARLEEAFAARISDCPADTRLLLLLAALDDSGETENLLRAAELTLGRTVSPGAFGPAVDAGLCAVEHGRVRFRHPLVRSAVRQASAAADRRRGHAALAEVWAGQPDLSVWHRAAAAAGPDEALADDLSETAARAELRGGADVAVAALELAAGLSADPVRQGRRLAQAVMLANRLGRWDLCQQLANQAARVPLDPYERTVISYLLELIDGRWPGRATVRAFIRVAQELAAAGDRTRALSAMSWVATLVYWAGADDEDRRRIVAIAEEAAHTRDDPVFLNVVALADPVGQGREVIKRLTSLASGGIAPGGFTSRELLIAGEAATSVWADDLALPILRKANEAFRGSGRLQQLTTLRMLEAWAHVRRGEIRAAYPAAAEAAGLAVETKEAVYRAAVTAALAVVAGERGDPGASELAAEAEAHFLAVGANPMLSLVELARGRTALAAERFSQAFDHLARVYDPSDIAHHPFVCGWALADIVDAAVYGERDLGLVRSLISPWETIAARTGSGYLRAQLAYAHAMLADEGSAEHQFAAALAVMPGWPAYRARTQLAYGTWLRRRRRSAESRAPLREAADTFSALGLLLLADRARRELRASGETVRQRQPEAWDQLTAQELQIAELAAEGLSNREIGERLYLSHRTVGFHLYKLFPKLGVTSRTELRAVLVPGASRLT